MDESARAFDRRDAGATARSLSVVIPAYNEEARIGPTLRRVHEYLRSRGEPFELVVVDDGSTDATASLVRRLSGEIGDIGDIRLISYSRNRGKGYAVKRGVLSTNGRHVLISDADLSTPIEETEKLLSICRGGAEVAFGSRALPDSEVVVKQSPMRRIMGRAFNLLVRIIALPGIRDTQCGFKCIDGAVARKLFEAQVTDGFAFDVELLARARKEGYRIEEVPVRWLDRASSTVRPATDAVAMFVDLIRVKRILR